MYLIIGINVQTWEGTGKSGFYNVKTYIDIDKLFFSEVVNPFVDK